MARTDAKLHSKGLGGETITTTIGYISPNATNNEIKTFAQMLNGITNNVYDNTDKVTTVNCDTEDDKQTPTIDTNITVGSSVYGRTFTMASDYTGNAPVYMSMEPNDCPISIRLQSDKQYRISVPNSPNTGTFTIPIYAPETTLYNKMETNLTITVQ